MATLRLGAYVLGSLAWGDSGETSPQTSTLLTGVVNFAALLRSTALPLIQPDDAIESFVALPSAVSSRQPTSLLLSAYTASPRLADVWLAGPYDLRLRFHAADTDMDTSLVLDAYQGSFTKEQPVTLLLAGAPLEGAIALVHVQLRNPFLPVLLVVRDAESRLRATDLLAFPSLTRGGMHSAEKSAFAIGEDDLQNLRATSDVLMAEGVRRRSPGMQTITDIEVDPRDGDGAEPIFDADCLLWIVEHHGIRVRLAKSSLSKTDKILYDHLKDRLSPYKQSNSLRQATLHLPHNGIPTISVLLCELAMSGDRKVAFHLPFIVIEPGASALAWSISLPSSFTSLAHVQPADAPVLPYIECRRLVSSNSTDEPPPRIPAAILFPQTLSAIAGELPLRRALDAPGPLINDPLDDQNTVVSAVVRPLFLGRHWSRDGIARMNRDSKIAYSKHSRWINSLRSALFRKEPANTLLKPSNQKKQADLVSVVIALEPHDGSIYSLLSSIMDQAGIDLEIILVTSCSLRVSQSLAAFLEETLPGHHVLITADVSASRDELIARAVEAASGETILLVSPKVLLHDPRTIKTLSSLVRRENVGSASCSLTKMSPSSPPLNEAGYCLTGADFFSSPSLHFQPIDANVFVRGITLPVVANSLSLLAIRKVMLEAIGGFSTRSTLQGVADLEFGLRVLDAGLVNICATVFTAFDQAPPMHERGYKLNLPFGSQIGFDRAVKSSVVIQRLQ